MSIKPNKINHKPIKINKKPSKIPNTLTHISFKSIKKTKTKGYKYKAKICLQKQIV